METIFSIASTWRQPLAVGVLFFLLVWESASPYIGYFLARSGYRLRHGAANITLGLLNSLVVAAIFVHLWANVSEWSAGHGFGLLHLYSFGGWVRMVLAILLLDLWTYWWHRLNHQVPFLWRFHKVHHSDPRMDVTTANRFHLGEIVISSLLRLALIPIFGVTLKELALFEALMFTNTQFHHANVGLSGKIDQLMRLILTSPNMHKVHHSAWRPETNSNYTALLSIWDRIFRSFRHNSDPASITFGLEDTNHPNQQTLAGLVKMPVVKQVTERGVEREESG